MYTIKFTKNASNDKKLLKESHLENKAKQILNILSVNPFQNPPKYERLVGDLDGYYSRRINIIHRIVYKVFKEEKIVVIYAMWTLYSNI